MLWSVFTTYRSILMFMTKVCPFSSLQPVAVPIYQKLLLVTMVLFAMFCEIMLLIQSRRHGGRFWA